MIRMIPNKDNTSKYFAFMHNIALFQGIKKEDLNEFFAKMQIEQYHKGEIQQFDPKQHSKLYIVFKGTFKLTNTNVEGDEIVLSLFSAGDAVTPLYFSPYFDVSAGFIEDTILFHFKENDVQRFIKNNHQFSMNNIKFLANSVQNLMITNTVLQLKTAKERVGWFLAHGKINNNSELPVSKNIIASFLGITPESFSRALSSLKNDGVTINNKIIQLDNGDELCKYCDRVTGSNCSLFRTEPCAHY